LIDDDNDDDDVGSSPSSRSRRARGVGGWGKGRATWKGQLARDSGNYGIMKRLTRELLQQRLEQVRADPSAKEWDRWTLSTIWYRLRKKFYALGVFDGEDKIPRSTRKTIQNDYIIDICRKELGGVKRAELGIYAAVRAQLYWNDEALDVTLKNIDKLAEHGTDVLIIEKEGIADVFAPFAAKVGIAILNPRGFLTENADDYSQLVLEKLEGNNVAILHDFDASGVVISKKTEGVVSLGVDLKLVKELRLQASQVEEAYNGSNSDHYKWLKANYRDYEYLDYLATKRIEIDSINAEVGAEKLWKVVLKRLEKAFPKRNYTRVIDSDAIFVQPDPIKLALENYESVEGDVIAKLNTYIAKKTEDIASSKKSEFTEELEDYEGIEEVDGLRERKTEEYNDACRDANVEPPDIRDVCKPIIEQLDEKIEQETADLQEEIDDKQQEIDDLEQEIEEKKKEQGKIAADLIETAEREQLIPAIKELDQEKDYSIVKDADLEPEDDDNDE